MNHKIFFLSIIISLASCNQKKIDIKDQFVEKYITSNKAIIVSCIRCECVKDFMKDYSRLSKNKIPIYADSNCIQQNEIYNFIQLSQKNIDSIYQRNYNMILIRKENGKNYARLLSSEQSPYFEKIITEFFK